MEVVRYACNAWGDCHVGMGDLENDRPFYAGITFRRALLIRKEIIQNMPFQILQKEKINSNTYRIHVEAPLVSAAAHAGQFLILRLNETGERIPLTIAESDPNKKTVTIIFQAVGKTTQLLAAFKPGDAILDLIGPLGKATDFGKVGKVLAVGGGVGVAEILPVIRYAKNCGNEVSAILGARSKEFVMLENEIRVLTKALAVTTDDGSYGRKGLVTDVLREWIGKEKFDLVYCVGPDVMMRAVCDVTKAAKIKTLVSLDAHMVDGTGMCGGCRVTVGGEIKFTCVDGPEFDGHLVDWDELVKRKKRFRDEESHACKIGLNSDE